ncbi:enoyl-CoA hydratase [Ignatzschineria indica]|uniref:Enoyl-CoA hydratase n=1 Tax=Ignatzschineria indica TaxID=472583 RepID=A0A2U2AIY2_9GAMM|nr:enoyl-CoA hydratase [Ignatzschineria indica]PWD82631.1 enoyl-CoA hydratase [Ignatzschineria indica]GGZ85429.1 enoyl-CoA hydratase [Ignatzschineria indica]
MNNNRDVVVTRLGNGVVTIQLNRLKTKNALDTALRTQLAEAFLQLEEEKEVRAVVLTGGDNFAAGADLNEMKDISSIEMYLRHTERYWQAISRFKKPIVAAVNGFALGGGCELAMLADIIIAGKGARFAQSEVKVGVMPGAGGTQRLIRAVGKFKALKLILTGEIISAEEAEKIGLVSELVEDEKTLDRAIEIAQKIASMPPLAIEQIKEVTLSGMDLPLESALMLERKAFQLLFDSKDQKEGVNAFFEKRKPFFKGE